MTNWLKIVPMEGLKFCCSVRLSQKKKRELAEEGDSVTCPDCKRTWIRLGDELRLKED
jgi:predicted  nucleic acid-binding Zn-ribbon protein